jgi:hypothetical protein
MKAVAISAEEKDFHQKLLVMNIQKTQNRCALKVRDSEQAPPRSKAVVPGGSGGPLRGTIGPESFVTAVRRGQ